MANLYELTGEMIRVKELLDQDYSEEILEGLTEVLTDTASDYSEKLENYALFIRNLNADLEAFKAEEKFFAEKKKATEKKIETLKEAMYRSMKATETPKVKGSILTISVQKNPASVVVDIDDWKLIPLKYLIQQEPKIDKAKLKADLNDGIYLDGIAHLEQKEGIRIK